MFPTTHISRVAIACGGTGGHLFPGLAVAEVLGEEGCEVTLIVSEKPFDQEAIQSIRDLEIVTLPSVGLQNHNYVGFVRGFLRSYRAIRSRFRQSPPQAVLAFGGFTSAPPILAASRLGAATFLHEANSVAGRSNRLLAPLVDQAFVSFPSALERLRTPLVRVTGMPVRPQFQPMDAASCRTALGLKHDKPVLLVTGGSQGASAINQLLLQALPILRAAWPELQYLHLTGSTEHASIREAYAHAGQPALVFPFMTEMELALGAATLAVSRAGASFLAEAAAMRLPSILVPYPAAADNHQFHNARAFAASGAALLLEQSKAAPETLSAGVLELLRNPRQRERLAESLSRWVRPNASREIAGHILEHLGVQPRLRSAIPDTLPKPAQSMTLREQSRETPLALLAELEPLKFMVSHRELTRRAS